MCVICFVEHLAVLRVTHPIHIRESILSKCYCVVVMFRNMSWIERFCSNPDNTYMCEVDEEYIRDSFNLYGLDSDCHYYKQAINMILDSESSVSETSSGRYMILFSGIDEEDIGTIKDTAEYLYGMIHARYIISLDGLDAMVWFFFSYDVVAGKVQTASFWCLLKSLLSQTRITSCWSQ